MGFFENLKKKRELANLERQVEQNPTAVNLAILAERYLQMSQPDKAFEIAQQGVKAFPNSEKILRTFRYIKKLQLQAKIRELNSTIQTNPNPVAYGQLAMIYKDLGETHKAVDVCTDLTKKFPLSENSFLIIGEIRYQRFHEDLLAKDGQTAIENLEKALELNSSNYKALLLSAEIYIEIGILDRATRNLQQILAFAPTDDRVARLLREAEELSTGQPVVDEEDKEWLFIQVENRRQFMNVINPPEFDRMIVPTAGPSVVQYVINADVVKRQVNALSRMQGLLGALAMNRETGEIIAERIVLRISRESLEDLLKTTFRVAHNAALRMDVGSFSQSILAGDFGSLHLRLVEGIVLAVLVDPQTRAEMVESSLQEIVPGLANAATAVKKQ
jgi:tetratricopeptide (TPR) repeat protein